MYSQKIIKKEEIALIGSNVCIQGSILNECHDLILVNEY